MGSEMCIRDRIQRDEIVEQVETSRNASRKPPKAHTQARNVSPLTQVNDATQAANGNERLHEPRTNHCTAQATNVALTDKKNTAPTAGKAGPPRPHTTEVGAAGQLHSLEWHNSTMTRVLPSKRHSEPEHPAHEIC